MSLDTDPVVNPYLSGAFEPIHGEVTATDLPIIGELPAGLRGRYLRNGPNPQFDPIARYHVFDGDGMVHGIDLADGAFWRAGLDVLRARIADYEHLAAATA